MELAYLSWRGHIFHLIDFHYCQIPILELVNVSLTFTWTYLDVFIMMLSIGLNGLFEVFYQRIEGARGKVRRRHGLRVCFTCWHECQLICLFFLFLVPPFHSGRRSADAVQFLDRDTHPLCYSAKSGGVCGPTYFSAYRHLVRQQSVLYLLAIIQQFHRVSSRREPFFCGQERERGRDGDANERLVLVHSQLQSFHFMSLSLAKPEPPPAVAQ